jgi:hypothetical protein
MVCRSRAVSSASKHSMHSCLVSLRVLQEFCSGQFWQKIFSKSFNGGVGWFSVWGLGA